MRIRHRSSAIDQHPAGAADGFEHLPAGSLDVLRWLASKHVEFVLVGAIARSVRGDAGASGPVAIVPAPYRRNIERLVRACADAHARLRAGDASPQRPDSETLPVKLTAAKLLDVGRWRLRLGTHDLDVEGRPRGAPLYQELLYEAERIKVTPELELEVASLEGIELYDHIARTGVPPEIRVSRAMREADRNVAPPTDHGVGASAEP
ncbi:MAG: hypothetical protein ACLP0J_06775 [Solirubrobacteraceae bacterium]|jgi:hypothetical protein